MGLLPVLRFQDYQQHLIAIRSAIGIAADPYRAVAKTLSCTSDRLVFGAESLDLLPESSIYIVAFGKASCGMIKAARSKLGTRFGEGVASIPIGSNLSIPGIEVHHGGHPLPDEGSIAAGRAVGDLLSRAKSGDIVLVLISGGGSAMLEWPLPGIQLNDLRELTQLLLLSGAPIEKINAVRKALSQTKAGGIARLAAPGQVLSLILSDVVGDRLTAIASGTTVLRRVSTKSARQVLEEYQIWDNAPVQIQRALLRESKPQPRSRRPINRLVGSNRLALNAAANEARKLGFTPRILTFNMHGEARDAAIQFSRQLDRANPGTCLLMGGETTVTIKGKGKGGRNQEFALAASLHLSGFTPRVAMSLATDGIDGPTDAAGAIVSSETRKQADHIGLDLVAALDQNDSYTVLHDLEALIQSGPSGTNVNDIVVGLAYP